MRKLPAVPAKNNPPPPRPGDNGGIWSFSPLREVQIERRYGALSTFVLLHLGHDTLVFTSVAVRPSRLYKSATSKQHKTSLSGDRVQGGGRNRRLSGNQVNRRQDSRGTGYQEQERRTSKIGHSTENGGRNRRSVTKKRLSGLVEFESLADFGG